jgi:hypothetical protein
VEVVEGEKEQAGKGGVSVANGAFPRRGNKIMGTSIILRHYLFARNHNTEGERCAHTNTMKL